MFKGRSCESVCDNAIPDELFSQGITNGADWYVLYGGMQDFNYLQSNCFEITVELGCYKYPYVDELPKYWNENRVALFNFVMEAHKGVKGFVFNQNGKPIKSAYIGIVGVEHFVKSTKWGDYWRLLLPGNYTMTVTANG
jgi:carboxypeptidase D